MENEAKELLEVKKPVKSMRIRNIPLSVHNKIVKYKADLTGKYRRAFTLEDAYVEFLKEYSKSVK